VTEPRTTPEATKLLLALSWPLIIQGLLFWLDSASNRYWMGRYLGAEGLAVHTTTAANVALLDLVFAGIASGCGVLVARSVGAKDGRGLSILAGSIAVSATVWLVIAGAFLALSEPLAGHLAKEGVAAESVRTYLVYWVLLTVPFNALVGLLNATAISAGWTKFAMTQAGMHLAMTVVLCPLFLRYGELGYAAPALAVACAGLVNSVLLWRMLKAEAPVRLHNDKADRRAAFDFKLWWQILDIGLPTQLSRVATRIVNVSVVLYVAGAGVATLAGFGVAMTFIEICGGACGGFARSVQITMGQDLGAGAIARARHVLNVAIPLALLVPTVAVGLLFVLARPIVEAFASDSAVIEEGVRAIRTVSWVLFPAAVWQVLLTAFAVAKAVKRVLLVTIIAQAFPLIVLYLWNGDELVGALLVMGMMYSLCLLFYLALAVPILYRGALAKPRVVE
jgi:Na+-driven multidrug efflux pump